MLPAALPSHALARSPPATGLAARHARRPAGRLATNSFSPFNFKDRCLCGDLRAIDATPMRTKWANIL
ncbi:hypothetical protein CFC21_061134 [Triticum aestivum]|uniref:Uncharacterized protein n=3 Tax=Triticum TaxID=4564 RepID=A0A341UEY8_WHEAT|nr:hypothetical protein CFC21_061126 [Triticum aestivum]KAF7053150.1 hypothetical protein CFC21_061134 [Triticum aestivum]VAI81778.1 unnamed protein product [Triticum turgidum subsp. durum]